jgi:hypothetical protein
VSRLRRAPRAPLAVAGILATPLFFVGLMAFSLRLDKPSVHVTAKGAHVLGDPAKAAVWSIYLAALCVSLAVVLVGVLAMPLRTRLAPIAPAVAAIVASVLLIVPLNTWAAQHTARYPLGVDLIKQSSAQDLILRGEWEQNAKTTAHEIGIWTIAIAIAAIAITVALDVRRRRGIVGPPVPPPPELPGGEPVVVPGASAQVTGRSILGR